MIWPPVMQNLSEQGKDFTEYRLRDPATLRTHQVDGLRSCIKELLEVAKQQNRFATDHHLWQVSVEVRIIRHKGHVGKIGTLLLSASAKATRPGERVIAPPAHDNAPERGRYEGHRSLVHVDAQQRLLSGLRFGLVEVVALPVDVCLRWPAQGSAEQWFPPPQK